MDATKATDIANPKATRSGRKKGRKAGGPRGGMSRASGRSHLVTSQREPAATEATILKPRDRPRVLRQPCPSEGTMGAGGDKTNSRHKRRNHLKSSSERTNRPRRKIGQGKSQTEKRARQTLNQKGKSLLKQGLHCPLVLERKEVVEKAKRREKVQELSGCSQKDLAEGLTGGRSSR